ncbi:aminopeptidase [Caldanaerobacter subterraneus KAk]|jgi:hypothetical protein|uniref:Thermophilic metalloprotease (M29) n=1 Tax=Caldanaerobacter subterraneus subsp. pacificus DSM 12653 TaxID=391606 RepID=A0A0F5PMI6_9THEO|nr:aminopeptidase [Caldanaerobacter subterraneus]KKC29887.1 hypothetical protein CDSM653_01116 [Caldanaerobacter subterraneus subsp. pacificus DSM 12653]
MDEYKKIIINTLNEFSIIYLIYAEEFMSEFQKYIFSIVLNSNLNIKKYRYNSITEFSGILDKLKKDLPLKKKVNIIYFKPIIDIDVKQGKIFHSWLLDCFCNDIYVLYVETLVNERVINYKDQIAILEFKAGREVFKSVKKYNEMLLQALNTAKKLRIISETGVDISFEFDRKDIYTEAFDIYNEKITQFPGGEVFLLPHCETVNGIIVQVVNNNKFVIKVKNGVADLTDCKKFINRTKDLLVEVGFGTNPAIPSIPTLDLYEKKLGTCHFGFGDSLLLNGSNKDDHHFDIVVPEFKMILDDSVLFQFRSDDFETKPYRENNTLL